MLLKITGLLHIQQTSQCLARSPPNLLKIKEISVVPTVVQAEEEDVETEEGVEVEEDKEEEAKAKAEAEAEKVEDNSNKLHLVPLHPQMQYHLVVKNGGTAQHKWRQNAYTQTQLIKAAVDIVMYRDTVTPSVVTKEWMSRQDSTIKSIHKLANCQPRSMPLMASQLQVPDSKKNRDLLSAQLGVSSTLMLNNNMLVSSNNNNKTHKI